MDTRRIVVSIDPKSGAKPEARSQLEVLNCDNQPWSHIRYIVHLTY